MTYTVVLYREPDGGYCVSVPALKGCHTQGDTLAESLFMAEDAIRGYLSVLQEDGDPIPPDSPHISLDMDEAQEALVCKLTVRPALSPAEGEPVAVA